MELLFREIKEIKNESERKKMEDELRYEFLNKSLALLYNTIQEVRFFLTDEDVKNNEIDKMRDYSSPVKGIHEKEIIKMECLSLLAK